MHAIVQYKDLKVESSFWKYIQLQPKAMFFFTGIKPPLFLAENENTSRDPGFQKIIYTNMQLLNRPQNEVLRILY